MSRIGDLAATDVYNAFDVPGEQTYDRRLDETWPGRLAQDAIGAVLAPGRALQSTEPITTEQMIKPAADLAGLVTGGSYAAPAQRGASGAGIRAYHSSPHDFDKFDLAKIGTGEGAQVYGHGLYFAESPAVSGQGGQYWNQFMSRFEGTPEGHAAGRLRAEGWDRDKALVAAQRDAADWKEILANARPDQTKYFTQMRDMRQREAELLASGKPVGPRTYEVNINADPAHMLDWDKAFPAQPQAVQEALRRSGIHPESPGPMGTKVMSDLPTGPMAERALRDPKSLLNRNLDKSGIPGIKYLDEGSRRPAISTGYRNIDIELGLHGGNWEAFKQAKLGKSKVLDDAIRDIDAKGGPKFGPQTSNYVVFDPNIIRIDKKYAIPGAIGAGGMGALAAQDRYEP